MEIGTPLDNGIRRRENRRKGHELATGAAPWMGDVGVGTLHIALEDGFTGDDVIVRVDGHEVVRPQVQTRWQIGLADSFELESDDRSCHVEVEVPARGAATALDVEADDEIWLGVSISADGDLTPRVSPEPFGYV